jgi:hypothetical protein
MCGILHTEKVLFTKEKRQLMAGSTDIFISFGELENPKRFNP